MSTKIYHGYRLAEGTDIWEFTERLRRDGNELRDRLDMKAIDQLADGVVAKRVEDGKELPETPQARLMFGYFVWKEIMDKLENSRVGDPHRLDVSFIRDPKTKRIHALLYAGSKMEDFWESQPGVEEYGYWDNTDRKEGVSDADWREREESWERCLPSWSPPGARALNFELRCDPTDGIIEMIYREKT